MYKQNTLFEINFAEPLAQRMRPTCLDEYVGQNDILGEDKPLRIAIENDAITSMILWGPPGSGKTTLANIIAKMTKSVFYSLSAVNTGVKTIKDILDEAKNKRKLGLKTILFVDEIHRYNKSQQDIFLPYVEDGTIILIAATTENPSFEINSALLSRTIVYILQKLERDDILKILKRAKDKYQDSELYIVDKWIERIAASVNGDARSALNLYGHLVDYCRVHNDNVKLTDENFEKILSSQLPYYKKNGDDHYNMISALHKSMRNSDYNAALYWLSRMLQGGEDPLYIARRLIRFSSEDIGLADPFALQQATLAFEACRYIGMPECDVNLTQAVVYLSLAPKSDSLYIAIQKSNRVAKDTLGESVPVCIRNSTSELTQQLGYGNGYSNPHDEQYNISNYECFPINVTNKDYYIPSQEGEERIMKKRIDSITRIKNSTT
jgi:putative ATPase